MNGLCSGTSKYSDVCFMYDSIAFIYVLDKYRSSMVNDNRSKTKILTYSK